MPNADDAPRHVSPSVRREVLSRDHHRCRICGQESQDDGYATHHIHHIEGAPTHCGRNDPGNLVTLCRQCHNWIHKRPTRSTVPIDLSDAADERLLPQDYEFLEKLYEDGPLAIEELQARLTADLSQIAIRERLWLLMGLDRIVEGQDQQLLDHSAISGEWGHPADIDDSERGRIPDDDRTLRRRIEDERIRRALDLGIDRQTVAEAFDVCSRTTRYKQRRARAYAFPLDAVDSSIVEDSGATVPSRCSGDSTTQRAPEGDDTSSTAVGPSAHTDATTPDAAGERPVLPAVDDDTVSDDNEAAPEGVSPTGVSHDDEPAPSNVDSAGGRADEDRVDQAMAVLSSSEDSDEQRLLLTVGLDDIEQDALMRYCANQGHSLSEMLKEWVTDFSEELVE